MQELFFNHKSTETQSLHRHQITGVTSVRYEMTNDAYKPSSPSYSKEGWWHNNDLEKSPQETVSQRVRPFYKKTLCGWLDEPSVYHGLTSTSLINSSWALPPVEPVGKSNSDQNQLREEQKHVTHHEKSSATFFTLLSTRYTLQFWWHWCHTAAVTLVFQSLVDKSRLVL